MVSSMRCLKVVYWGTFAMNTFFELEPALDVRLAYADKVVIAKSGLR